MNTLKVLCIVVVISFFAFSCGSGGGGGGEEDEKDSSAPSAQEGQFIDSPVEGLKYATDTLSGITNSDGTFKYKNGEAVTFYIEDVILGNSSGKQKVNPIDLVAGATDEMESTVTNICRLIQSLDLDVNPDMGRPGHGHCGILKQCFNKLCNMHMPYAFFTAFDHPVH